MWNLSRASLAVSMLAFTASMFCMRWRTSVVWVSGDMKELQQTDKLYMTDCLSIEVNKSYGQTCRQTLWTEKCQCCHYSLIDRYSDAI